MFFKIANRTIDKIGRILRLLLTVPAHQERDRRQDIEDAENERLKAEAEARFEVLLEAARNRAAIELPPIDKTVGCAVLQDNRTLTCEAQDTHQPENQMQRRADVFAALDEAKDWGLTGYEVLIEYVRKKTGKGCSRRQISRWQKERSAQEVA